MSPYIFRLTLGQIVGQRRTILILLFAAIPILLAVIFRIASTARNDPLEFYAAIFETLIIGLTLPLTALVFGTAALGQDIEDGTATYLLSKPVPRWQIVVEKTAAAWVITTIMLVASVSATGIVLLADEDGQRTIVAFTLAAALGALAYGALFVCLSVFFNRALIIGLVYVFIWEALVTLAVDNAQYVSVRGFILGIADPLSNVPAYWLKASLGPVESFALMAAVTGVSVVFASRRLSSFQVGDQT